MKVEKLVEKITQFLGIKVPEELGKKKSLKKVLKKLIEKKDILDKKLTDKTLSKKEKKDLLEELEIISIQIKKANKILEK